MLEKIVCLFKGHEFSKQRNIYTYSLFASTKGFTLEGDKVGVKKERFLVDICSCCGVQGEGELKETSKLFEEVDFNILAGIMHNGKRGKGFDFSEIYRIHDKPVPVNL